MTAGKTFEGGTMRRITSRLTYANVISSLCLFLVLGGGTAVALNGANTVFSDDIVNHQVKSDDLAKLAFTPVKLNPRTEFFDPCQSGQVGVFCGGVGSSGYRGWENVGSGFANVAYARDGLGIVHLRGAMVSRGAPGPQEAWFLPPGYRPPSNQQFAVAYGQNGSSQYSLSTIRVLRSGAVQFVDFQPGAGSNLEGGVSLDGVEFKAK